MKKLFDAIVLNTILPILVLAAAVLVAKHWIDSKEPPPQAPPSREAPLVEVITAQARDVRVHVEAQGSVVPARQTVVQVEVAGRVTSVNPALEVGGIVTEGADLVGVDGREYRIAADEAAALLAQAETNVELERGRGYIAEREWALFQGEPGADGGDAALALRQPQMRAAQVAVDAARARLERANLAITRTRVRAPFDAMVLSESVELGQLLSAQTPIATLVATDRFWVEVRVPLDHIGEIAIPGYNSEVGGGAVVRQQVGERTVERTGRVVRLLGSVDAAARMATVLVEVEDPLLLGPDAAATRAQGAVPLLLGSWVTLALDADRDEHVIVLPRSVVHRGTFVYVVGPESRLEIREVDIVGGDADTVEIRAGVAAGETVVSSHVATPVAGMELRVSGAEADGSGAPAEGR
ncbi:MAG: efflux RND transporter periplasmic adaptor subunit [Myxococcales bacterium]|nr:efflux RND transporter periplasmic adaptor subunit [Myxococcales bacterium]MCB9520274.1 efflux RND transporter periplasmic adaptor subunit [Myxococcales bacterium]MCB9531358.1 efflux RND transporter periplasmic adaptor subunit [Myxococcales bacterium]MCB9533569.1 efflux RND transporter periplasmic adaptor subunit [Myxococcales bacterium]